MPVQDGIAAAAHTRGAVGSAPLSAEHCSERKRNLGREWKVLTAARSPRSHKFNPLRHPCQVTSGHRYGLLGLTMLVLLLAANFGLTLVGLEYVKETVSDGASAADLSAPLLDARSGAPVETLASLDATRTAAVGLEQLLLEDRIIVYERGFALSYNIEAVELVPAGVLHPHARCAMVHTKAGVWRVVEGDDSEPRLLGADEMLSVADSGVRHSLLHGDADLVRGGDDNSDEASEGAERHLLGHGSGSGFGGSSKGCEYSSSFCTALPQCCPCNCPGGGSDKPRKRAYFGDSYYNHCDSVGRKGKYGDKEAHHEGVYEGRSSNYVDAFRRRLFQASTANEPSTLDCTTLQLLWDTQTLPGTAMLKTPVIVKLLESGAASNAQLREAVYNVMHSLFESEVLIQQGSPICAALTLEHKFTQPMHVLDDSVWPPFVPGSSVPSSWSYGGKGNVWDNFVDAVDNHAFFQNRPNRTSAGLVLNVTFGSMNVDQQALARHVLDKLCVFTGNIELSNRVNNAELVRSPGNPMANLMTSFQSAMTALEAAATLGATTQLFGPDPLVTELDGANSNMRLLYLPPGGNAFQMTASAFADAAGCTDIGCVLKDAAAIRFCAKPNCQSAPSMAFHPDDRVVPLSFPGAASTLLGHINAGHMDPDKPLFGMVTANLIPCGFASTTSSAGGKSKGLTATKVTTSKLSKTASTGKIAMPIHSFKKPKKP